MFHRSKSSEDGGWLSLSDMMTVLMVLFLIISVTIAVTSTSRLAKMTGVLSYVTKQEDLLCQNLEEFEKNSNKLTSDFERALEIFFPIYLQTVDKWELRDLVDEIRIEGHTDSDGRYIYNMELSQDRARNVLSFAITLPELKKSEAHFQWSKSLLTANGLSYSRRLDQGGKVMRFPFKGEENKDRSRRVEVKLRTNTKEVLLALQKRT